MITHLPRKMTPNTAVSHYRTDMATETINIKLNPIIACDSLPYPTTPSPTPAALHGISSLPTLAHVK